MIPELKGKLDGFAVRVPTPNVSAVDLVPSWAATLTVEEVNAAMKKASETAPLKGYLQLHRRRAGLLRLQGRPGFFDSGLKADPRYRRQPGEDLRLV